MKFTLVYRGDLPPNGSAKEKWRIRRELEPQLRRLWTIAPFSDIAKYLDPAYEPNNCYVGKVLGEFEFMPLISTKLDLQANLEIRPMSSSMPGGLLHSGDIDNRLKTLFDALSIPTNQQIPDGAEVDADKRVFCLCEDDRLITDVRVTNNRLLSVDDKSRQTLVVIDVRPVAFRVTFANIGISV